VGSGQADIWDLITFVEENDKPNLNNMLRLALEKSKDGGMDVSTYTTPAEWVLPERSIEHFMGSVPQYALDRGLTLSTCKEWELGHDQDEEDPRLVFTVRDYEQQLVGVVGRALRKEALAKYKNYEGFHGAHYLYGEHKLDTNDERPLVLVEGMLDVLISWQHGICQPLGIFGSRLTTARARKLEMLVGRRTVLTLFDPDSAGDDARSSVEEHLGGKVPIFHRRCPDEKDPGALDKRELEAILLGN